MSTARLRVGAGITVLLVAGALISCVATQDTPDAPPPPTGPASSYPVVVPPAQQLYRVDSVYDGDTLRVLLPSGASAAVRVLGIDAPEMRAPQPPEDLDRSDAPPAGPECGAVEARDAARAVLAGQSVLLTEDPGQPGQDQYGRLLRYVEIPEAGDLADLLLYGGFVQVFEEYPVSRTPHYQVLQADAIAREAGSWAVCGWLN